MKTPTKKCSCKGNDCYVLACSGACDLGNIADLVARKLSEEGIWKMHCLAVVGAGVDAPTNELRNSSLLVIDGCSVDCAKKIVDKADFKDYSYLRISDMGYEKGKSGVTRDNIDAVYQVAAQIN